MGEVIEVNHWIKSVFQCPQCRSQAFYIVLDKLGYEFENILAFECFECGHTVKLQKVSIEQKKKN